MSVFRFFEHLLEPTGIPAETPPPSGLLAFYWHYARQAKGLVVALFVAGFTVAALDTTIPVFIGKMVTLLSTKTPDTLLGEAWPWLIGMAVGMLVRRPSA